MGVSGKSEIVYSHTVTLNIGGNNLSIVALFKKSMPMEYGIIGQIGFFSNFVVIFDYRKERIELKPKPDIN